MTGCHLSGQEFREKIFLIIFNPNKILMTVKTQTMARERMRTVVASKRIASKKLISGKGVYSLIKTKIQPI